MKLEQQTILAELPLRQSVSTSFAASLSSVPLIVWLIGASLCLILAGGPGAAAAVAAFNSGFGRSLGEFALILLPAFAIAAALTGLELRKASTAAIAASPFAAAAMVCPDTAYVALAPVAPRRRLAVAFGSYAGFKLLHPAGPLIVAGTLGLADSLALAWGMVLLVPVWLCGALWARGFDPGSGTDRIEWSSGLVRLIAPICLIFLLLAAGALAGRSAPPLVGFVTSPKGALLVAACAILARLGAQRRAKCIDTAVRRTAPLLLLVGASSAFGAAVTAAVPIGQWVPAGAAVGTVSIFLLAASFKLLQGSSMATFAAVPPVIALLLPGMAVSPTAAVLATCLGSLFAIAPNDSFYWIVRKDALADRTERMAALILIGGSALQAVVGLSCLLLLVRLGLL